MRISLMGPICRVILLPMKTHTANRVVHHSMFFSKENIAATIREALSTSTAPLHIFHCDMTGHELACALNECGIKIVVTSDGDNISIVKDMGSSH